MTNDHRTFGGLDSSRRWNSSTPPIAMPSRGGTSTYKVVGHKKRRRMGGDRVPVNNEETAADEQRGVWGPPLCSPASSLGFCHLSIERKHRGSGGLHCVHRPLWDSAHRKRIHTHTSTASGETIRPIGLVIYVYGEGKLFCILF